MSALVLIADANTARAERIVNACAVRGFATQRVPNGAEALEAALAQVPDVLLAAADLDLIAPLQLGEILRANPRTQGMRLFFLGTPGGEAQTEACGAEVLAPDADPEAVVHRIETLIARNAQLDDVERQADGNREVHGSLTQLPLPDLLQLFQMSRRTGTISVRRRTADGREERGRVHVRDGETLQAVTGAVDGEKALLRLLAWSDGSFSFRPEPVQLVPRIHTGTRALLLEGMRQLDEWRALGPSLPSLDAEVTLRVRTTELPNVVHPVTQEVLLLLEIYSRVRDVVDRCSFPDYQVLRTLQTLIERGLVRLRKEPAPTNTGPGLFSRGQLRRLREWIAPPGSVPGTLPDAKLLLVSPDVGATRELLALLSGLPGMDPEPRLPRERLGAHDLGRVGRLQVDAEFGIELLHVPCEPALAPLWALAGYGALGALLLLPGSAPAAARALQPVAQVLRTLPRVRLLPLLLGREGETALPDEVTESLALFDESSACFLSLSDEAEPAARLRSVLARLVP